MDVTDQILLQTIRQGGSDNTNPATIAAAKVLNYAIGATATQAEREKITSVPYTVPFRDAVGLGVDNFFVKFKIDVDEPRFSCFEPPGWECARINLSSTYNPHTDYEDALIREGLDNENDLSCGSDTICWNSFEPVKGSKESFYANSDARLSVRIVNKGTGNIYVDRDFDCNLMKKNRRPIQEDTLWCTLDDEFFIAFHARNTKRIPYDVDLIIGEKVINKSEIPGYEALNDVY